MHRTAPLKPRQRRLKADERKQQLIDATIVCLAKYGAQGTGVRQICREVNVAPSLVSYFFAGGRNELFVNAYNLLAKRFVDALEAAARSDERGAKARMQAVIDLYLSKDWLEDTVVGAYVSLWSLSRTEVDLKAAMSGLHERQTSAVAGPLAALAAERGAKVDVDLMANSLVMFLTGLWLELGLNPGNIPPARANRICWAWLDGSLAGQDEASRTSAD